MIEFSMEIIKIAKRILAEYSLCAECFGRQFALLGSSFTNTQRAHSILNTLLLEYHHQLNVSQDKGEIFINYLDEIKEISIHTNHEPAHQIIRKFEPEWKPFPDFTCYLCNNLFSSVDSIVKQISNNATKYEFSNYLVGTGVNAKILDREDEFRARLDINSGESLKKNINRVVGKNLEELWKKPVEFNNPELSIQLHLEKNQFHVTLTSNPLCIKGKYRKYLRGIPQTHWPHRLCKGKGCEKCNYTGKQYPMSVEELISPPFLLQSQSENSVFHGAGREDIDARCLGTGRPFIIELKEPQVRTFNLYEIQLKVNNNQGDKVEIFDLEFVNRSEIKNLKCSGETTAKTYNALIKSEIPISRRNFKQMIGNIALKVLENPIQQRTPLRVVHRRADLTRKRSIFAIEFRWKDKFHFYAKIKAMGGTYIKEFISGDKGRTKISLAELFGIPMVCMELDIIDIEKLQIPKL